MRLLTRTPRPTNPPRASRPGLLAGMRIRIKLMFLHTCFSLALAGVLVLALRPAIAEVVKQAEQHEAAVILSVLMAGNAPAVGPRAGPGVLIVEGAAGYVGIDEATAKQLVADAKPVVVADPGGTSGSGLFGGPAPRLVGYNPDTGKYVLVSVTLQGARDAVVRLYVFMLIALLVVYALVAAALEVFVLPQHVYGPIRTMLEADEAVQQGRRERELIPESAMPADELGSIMRSRNLSIVSLREHEHDLGVALAKLEEVATDLKRKNHLLEMTRRNMADADRLASLGLMSAGIAHELNTPLAVLKGLVEKLNREVGEHGNGNGAPLSKTEAALMLRVVGRLEGLSESLLDFARVRPHSSARVALRPLVEEAWTLVRLDRAAAGRSIEFVSEVPPELHAWCDGDRIVQVLVNLIRNAVDATGGPRRGGGAARIVVTGEAARRAEGVGGDGARSELWASITITDNGPGIDPDILPHLFEPFASTRLDSNGTGLGLAVAEGIVREHGGVLLARNRSDQPGSRAPGNGETGAVFEIMLPVVAAETLIDSGPAERSINPTAASA